MGVEPDPRYTAAGAVKVSSNTDNWHTNNKNGIDKWLANPQHPFSFCPFLYLSLSLWSKDDAFSALLTARAAAVLARYHMLVVGKTTRPTDSLRQRHGYPDHESTQTCPGARAISYVPEGVASFDFSLMFLVAHAWLHVFALGSTSTSL